MSQRKFNVGDIVIIRRFLGTDSARQESAPYSSDEWATIIQVKGRRYLCEMDDGTREWIDEDWILS